MLSKLELDEFKKIAVGNHILEKVLQEIESIHGDPTRVFYKELNQTIIALSKELGFIRLGQKELAHIIASDDKTFERVSKLLTDSEKIFSGLRKGKEDVFPEEAKSDKESEGEKGMSFADRVANKKRKE
jgi:hypothetical protein